METNSQKLVLRDGHFWRGNEKVPPKFGDIEQIKLLKEAEKRSQMKEVEASFRSEEVAYVANVKFVCPNCKKNEIVVIGEDDPFEWDPNSDDLHGEEIECPNCDTYFEIEKGDAWNKIKLLIIDNE
jgi:predicted RNA-binding Zn-ribbon protein involved in translation (DUF1610 family)